MRNVRSRQCGLLTLVGLSFLLAFFIGSEKSVQAASNINNSGRDCTYEHNEPSFGGAVVVDTNATECGNLTTFGGTVAINGVVRGDIVAFNSDVVVAGTVNGNIEMYGGNVVLQSGSQIHGDINLYGARWTQGTNAQINGAVVDHTGNLDWLITSYGSFRFSFWFLLTWVALGILLTFLLPEHVMLVRTTVVSKARRSFVIGLLSILLAPPVLIVLIALVLSIPLAIIVGLGLIAAWALGTVAIGWQIGDYIIRRIAPSQNSGPALRPSPGERDKRDLDAAALPGGQVMSSQSGLRGSRQAQVAVGLTVLVLAGTLPYIGWLISIGAGLLGLGAVFLSRFGTRLYSQPKQPLTL